MTFLEPESDDQLDSDRRMFARLKAEVVLRCVQDDAEGPGVTLDVSAQGLGMIVPVRFEPSSEVKIFLILPETKEEFATVGKIAWCTKVEEGKFRVGVWLDKPELMLVSQLLNRLSSAG
jgi:hypothetical protein